MSKHTQPKKPNPSPQTIPIPTIPTLPTTLPTTLKQKALSVLLSYLGEIETGNNTGPVVDWAMHPWSAVKPDSTGWAAWCAAAVCTSYVEAGSLQIKKLGTTAVSTLFRRLEINRQIYYTPPGQQQPEPGDLVFFRSSVGSLYHVGLVESYHYYSDRKTHELITIEGNSNNQVERTTYYYNEALHRVKPWYGFGWIKD